MRLSTLAASLLFAGVADAAGPSKAFPPGWNGLARTPPMGWRSWNAFGNRITQDMMIGAAEAMVAKNRTVNSKSGLSLCDLGYCSVGVDEGWEGCGQGVEHTQHDAQGNPTIDSTFPDTGAMVKQIHGMGLECGWYLNGCKCGERVEKTLNYQGDIRSLHKFDFDGVKIDGCGRQRNQTLYAELMRQSGKNYTIENCHWGDCTDSDDSSCPTQEWCPFNWYRTSGDINAGAQSWLGNLQTAIRFLDYDAPLSQPGCWAYPDMLEVGRVAEPAPGTFYNWNRAHFGAWCIVSAPLILGLSLDDKTLTPVLDIIGNEEAIKVNQQWEGHPGMLVDNIMSPPQPYSPSGTVVPSSTAGDFDVLNGARLVSGRPDNATSGAAQIRSGDPGGVSMVRIGVGLAGNGHSIDGVSLSFRYVAGYTPGPGQDKKAPTVRVLFLDLATSKVLKATPPTTALGNFSYDHFTGYSPPVPITATGLVVPADSPVIIALEITNNERNLQIPVDDLKNGFDVRVTWTPSITPAAATSTSIASTSANRDHHHHQAPGGNALGLGVFGLGQLWAKKQPAGASAALLINHGSQSLSYTIDFAKLNLTKASTYTVRNIWDRNTTTVNTHSMGVGVEPYDSAFLLITPVA